MNTKERGDVAIGHAIAFYLQNGYEVCLPIGDKRRYDFLVEKEGEIRRVQVKYAGLSNRNKCVAGLRITGGNQSFNYAKKYRDNDFDILFVYTERDEKYAIPWKKISCRNELSVESGKYEKFRL